MNLAISLFTMLAVILAKLHYSSGLSLKLKVCSGFVTLTFLFAYAR